MSFSHLKTFKAATLGMACLLALLVMTLGAKASAATFDITAAADAYVVNDNSAAATSPHANATNTQLRYFRDTTGTNRRMTVGFFRFDLTAAQTDPSVVLSNIQLSLSGFSNSVTGSSGNKPLHLYGVKEAFESAAATGMTSGGAGTLTYDNAPGLDDGTALYDTTNEPQDRAITLVPAEITAELAAFNSPGYVSNQKVVTPVSAAMDAFVNQDTNGILIFMITPNSPASDPAGAAAAAIDTGVYFNTLETATNAAWNPDATFKPRILGTATATAHANVKKVAHWPLDETTGTVAVDTVAALNGTLTNFGASPAWTPDTKSNGGLTFDGVDDQVLVNDGTTTATNFSTGDFSISFLVKQNGPFVPSGGFTRNTYFSKGTYAATTGVRYEAFDDGTNFTFSVDDGTNQADCTVADTAIATNTWIYVVCVRDSASHKLYIYVNGIQAANATDTTTGVIDNFTEKLDFGYSAAADKPASVGYLAGGLDDIRICKVALNSLDIAAIRATYAADNAARNWTVFE